MKLRKLTVILLLIVLFVSQITWITFNNFSYATENVGKFHYDQLNSEAKVIYDAMYNMYIQGILKTGMQDYDLVENGLLTTGQVKEYASGNSELISAMNAARYAFYADYPEIFYVNFQKLTIRTTKDANGNYHAYIGSGRYANYYTPGFENKEEVETAINDFNAKVNEIVEKSKTADTVTEQVKIAHNEIIRTTGYRLETDCTEGNEGFISTPYGALVKGQAVCEGYSRAFKTVLDKLGINCILVQGIHQYEGEAAVPHMWNYVEIPSNARSAEGTWYAVDATMDDPFTRYIYVDNNADKLPGSDIVEGFENTRFCLVGTETMNREHTPLETIEAAGNYTFKYPELSVEDYGIDTVVNSNGLLVKYKQEGTEYEEYQAGDYYVSCNGKGYDESIKDGKYILMKSYYYNPGDETWDVSAWAYLIPDPDLYAGGFLDYEDHLYITVPNSEYVEFAVTTLAPGDYKNDPIYLSYQGDESDFVARSGKLYNPQGTYKGRPYVKTQTPAPTAYLTVGPTYHVDVTYDDDLVFPEGVTQAGYKLTSTGHSGAENTEITNFTFDGKRRITFDIKFSKMFADDGSAYTISITGLVGKNSGKAPMDITYGARNYIACAPSMNASKNWQVFGTPALIENEDLSMQDWETSDGTPLSDKLKSRITLVTTRTTSEEETSMNDLMEKELGDKELKSSQTYNISLNVCKKYVVKTGHRLRISLGFPEGYGPEHEGVTFKAYHFIRDAKGNVTGVEEIPCVVTQYGLIITCDSFSPFAIAVVDKEETDIPEDKSVIISATDGGVINGAHRNEGNIVTLSENESATLKVIPDEGYEIETVTVCGKNIAVSDKSSMDVTINYDDVKDGENIVYATFIAKQVAQVAEERGEIVVEPIVTGKLEDSTLPKFSSTILRDDDATIYPGDEFTVNVNIHDFNNIEDGLLVLGGQLDYDKTALELVEVKGQNGWDMTGGFNSGNLKFVIDREEHISENSTVFTIKFRAKEKLGRTLIAVRDIEASNAITDITSRDAEITIEIAKQPDSFISEKYVVDGEYLTRIVPETTVSQFKENVTAYPSVVIKNSEGETLNDNDIIGTGMILQVGETIEYTLIVTGDTNGDGKLNTTDIARLKLHYIEEKFLTGANLKAADLNYDGNVTITDVAKIKLVYIQEKNI